MTAPFVTILAADVDSESASPLEALRALAGEHGASEVGSTGTGVVVALSSAAAAVRCAIAMQRALDPAEVRIGMDAGEPDGDGYGRPLIVAERLCAVADAGDVLVTEVVRAVAAPHVGEPMRPAGAMRLRGVGEPVAVAQVEWRVAEPAEPAAEQSAASRISVVIADDQQLLRAGFRVILNGEPDIAVVGEAADGRAAIETVTRLKPDVVLMDIRMPELDGLAAAEEILGSAEVDTAVVILTTFDASEYVYRALRIGASGFLLKDAPADRLLEAVRVAAAGDALIAPSITRRLVEQFARNEPRAAPERAEKLADLTAREVEVLALIARGLSNAEIADELVLGQNTVKTHVGRVLFKLGLRDRAQAVVVAYESGLVQPTA